MEFIPKTPKKYECELCHYKTCSLKDFNKHSLTSKHLNKANLNILEQKNPKNPQTFNCKNCNKCYKARNSLWYHQQKCISHIEINNQIQTHSNLKNELSEKELTDKDNFIIELLKQNKELLEIIKNGTHNNITTHTNSHNKAFNLNFFLNETCKDAMNINEFIESIKLQLSDLEGVGQLGYVEGISNIIVKNLKQLDITQRPVHCTDKKRETIYIKDEDKWEKDDEKEKMHKIVRKIADKNARMLPKFKEAHPDCNKAASKYSDAYNKIIVESMGGSGDNNFEKEEKIIKKVSKEVMIEK
jgi:hypothetical protein